MPQWGHIFYEGDMRIVPLIRTQAFRAIQATDIVEGLFLLDGIGDIITLRKKYLGLTYDELKKKTGISEEADEVVH